MLSRVKEHVHEQISANWDSSKLRWTGAKCVLPRLDLFSRRDGVSYISVDAIFRLVEVEKRKLACVNDT